MLPNVPTGVSVSNKYTGGDIPKIPTAEDNFHALTLQLLEHKHSDFEDSLDSGSMYIV